MADFFVFVGTVGFTLGVVACFKRLPIFRISTRKRALALLGSGFVVMMIGGAMLPPKEKDASQTRNGGTAPSQSAPVEVSYAFDVPSLIGKSAEELKAEPGVQPSESPTPLQVSADVKEWEFTIKREGRELLVTYTIATGRVTDFFLGTNDPSGATRDKASLLKAANLKEGQRAYKVELVPTIRDRSAFTGVKAIPQ